MDRKRILVVDDDRFIRRAVRHLVECLGHDCIEAGAGDEAHRVALEEKPDLIVLDVMLPGINGYEVSRMIKEEVQRGTLGRDIPILIVTARRTDSEEREEFLRTWSQADAFIYKPFDFEYLSERIVEFLEAAEAGEADQQEEQQEQSETGAEAGEADQREGQQVQSETGAEVTHVEEVRSGD